MNNYREEHIQVHIAVCKVETRKKLSPNNQTSGSSISVYRSKRNCARKNWAKHLKETSNE